MIVVIPILVQILPLFQLENLDSKIWQGRSCRGLSKCMNKLDQPAILLIICPSDDTSLLRSVDVGCRQIAWRCLASPCMDECCRPSRVM